MQRSVLQDFSFWKDRSVFLTGHTGFKGSWLCVLLSHLGAKVHGYSLQPPTKPSLFEVARIEDCIASSTIGDIRDRLKIQKAFLSSEASIAFHLAAQPMVLSSYEDPFETFDINVSGTVSFLDAARKVDTLQSAVVITTDKCYENKEWLWAYREDDLLGGHDPYSNSKACCELAVQSFRKSFFLNGKDRSIGLATARAGNIIGGGDWGVHRLVPDFFRAYASNEPLTIRNPNAVRPWQHVLEPLTGYITLAQNASISPKEFSTGWNLGPDENLVKSVKEIIDAFQAKITQSDPKRRVNVTIEGSPHKLHEAQMLRLDCSKAKQILGWKPRLDFDGSISRTLDWYEAFLDKQDMQSVTKKQVESYLQQC